jgi:tRNA-Thr(GGU) m(6)t(6)A37 methyltransferase TsaA
VDTKPLRPGEIALSQDPANIPGDTHLVFIGRVRSPWVTLPDVPKNMRAALARGLGASLEIDAGYRAGLRDLGGYSHIYVVTWLAQSRRDIIVQKPRHLDAPRGVFALRSPIRPNPIGLSIARLLSVDVEAGRLTLDAIDVLDGTPVLDIKPYLPSVDAVVDATGP